VTEVRQRLILAKEMKELSFSQETSKTLWISRFSFRKLWGWSMYL